MTRDTAFITELWAIISPVIDRAERVHTAEAIVELFDEYAMVDGLEESDELEGPLAKAVKSYFDIDDGYDGEDE